jgi:peptide/nickel transport system permease protein
MSERQKLFRVFKHNKTSMVGSLMAVFIISVAVLAPLIATGPNEQHVEIQYQKPGLSHLFGTDGFGRDVFARVVWGTRISLLVGFLSVLLALIFGVSIGIIAGYKRGLIDQIILRYIDIFMSFPMLIMGLFVLAILGTGLSKIILAIAFAMTPRVARLVRGSTLSVREMEYVQAGRAMGQKDTKIMSFHIFPNIVGDALVMGALWIGNAILIESSLSFVGLGVSPPTASWGAMIRDGLDQLTNAPHMCLFPGLGILFTVFAFNLVADGLRDIADPKLRG